MTENTTATPEDLAKLTASLTPGVDQSLDLKTFVRTPFSVKAIQVTEENIVDVALWCGGEITYTEGEKSSAIDVPVYNALSDAQARAQIGDWVLRSETRNGPRWKVYRPHHFVRNFTEVRDNKLAIVFVDR